MPVDRGLPAAYGLSPGHKIWFFGNCQSFSYGVGLAVVFLGFLLLLASYTVLKSHPI